MTGLVKWNQTSHLDRGGWNWKCSSRNVSGCRIHKRKMPAGSVIRDNNPDLIMTELLKFPIQQDKTNNSLNVGSRSL